MEVEPEVDALTKLDDLIKEAFSPPAKKKVNDYRDDGELNHHQIFEPVQPELHLEDEKVPEKYRSCSLHPVSPVFPFQSPPVSTRNTKETVGLIQSNSYLASNRFEKQEAETL